MALSSGVNRRKAERFCDSPHLACADLRSAVFDTNRAIVAQFARLADLLFFSEAL
jgi:hypothetical protein